MSTETVQRDHLPRCLNTIQTPRKDDFCVTPELIRWSIYLPPNLVNLRYFGSCLFLLEHKWDGKKKSRFTGPGVNDVIRGTRQIKRRKLKQRKNEWMKGQKERKLLKFQRLTITPTIYLLPVTIWCFHLQHLGHQNEGKYYHWNWVDLPLENIWNHRKLQTWRILQY